MRIKTTTTFLHGTKKFEEGKRYTVTDLEAGYFIGQGWATSSDGKITGVGDTADVTLDVQDVEHDVTVPEAN